MAEPGIYTTGGTVQAGSGLYIPRQADEELLALCRTGVFAYVLAPRQVGKSSLMVRTAERLKGEGFQSVIIDLTQLGIQLTAEEWYLGLLVEIESQLALTSNVVAWWQERVHLSIIQRLTLFFKEVLLVEVAAPVVIFIDEIDTTLSLAFTDDFYAAIRSLYDARARLPELRRLSFVLIGVATPGDLIRDPKRAPFNIGQRVDLTDWTFDEALPLADGLELPTDDVRQVLKWTLKWTEGHPYLTQRLCRAVADQRWSSRSDSNIGQAAALSRRGVQSIASRSIVSEADVDRIVANTFFVEKGSQDTNLQFVRDMLTMPAPHLVGVLATYREIRLDWRPVQDEEQSLVKSYLKLSGIVRRVDGLLRVRNPIYAHVFDVQWVKEHWPGEPTKTIYTAGGTVQAGGGLYISRTADVELLAFCRAGAFAYIFGPRQIGKSSLMVRTAGQLAIEGIRSVTIDLSQLGVKIAAEAWYFGLLDAIADQLKLKTDVILWWRAHAHMGLTQRLILFFREVLLVEVAEPVVVFIDEIDTTLSLALTDDFYAAIRYLYNARAQEPRFRRLSFVLIGVAMPSDLIRDPQRTPFNIGKRVELTDWTLAEALPLAEGLDLPPDTAYQVFHWVLKWTGGHPYLTQRLCRAIVDQGRESWSETDLSRVVAAIFFNEKSVQDNNLQFVRDMLTKRAPNLAGVLTTYREIWRGQRPIRDEEQSLVKSHLKLAGIVRGEDGVLRVRNPIYRAVFNERWIKEQLPGNWNAYLQRGVVGLIAILLITLFSLALYTQMAPTSTHSVASTKVALVGASTPEVATEASPEEKTPQHIIPVLSTGIAMVPSTGTSVPPTNTPVPPTDTPVPPTDTPVPLTDTPVPPTDTPVPIIVQPEQNPIVLHPSRVSASAQAPSRRDAQGNPVFYDPQSAVDGHKDTTWRVIGDGVEQWIQLDFPVEISIQAVGIIPGYDKIDSEGDRFRQNHVVKVGRLEFSDGTQVRASFTQQRDMQFVSLGGIHTHSIRIVIEETYQPLQEDPDDTTAISEVQVQGIPVLPSLDELAIGQQAVTKPSTARDLWTAPDGGGRVLERPKLYGGALVTVLDIQPGAVKVQTPEGVEGWIHEPADEALTSDLSIVGEQARFIVGVHVQVVRGNGVPLRDKPHSGPETPNQFKPGQQATIQALLGDWLNLTLDDGRTGWARWYLDDGTYIDVVSRSPRNPPSQGESEFVVGQQAVTKPPSARSLWTAPEGGGPVGARPKLYGGALVIVLAVQPNAVQVSTPEGVVGWIHERAEAALTSDLTVVGEQARFIAGVRVQVVGSESVPLRKGPDHDAGQLDSFKPGQQATVQDLRGDWLKITLDTGVVGWVRWYLNGEIYIDIIPGQEQPVSFTRRLFMQNPTLYGEDIKVVQQRLLDLGYTEVGEADGIFGPNTESAVKRFQLANGLDVDGIVGSLTWNQLFSDKAIRKS